MEKRIGMRMKKKCKENTIKKNRRKFPWNKRRGEDVKEGDGGGCFFCF